MDEEQIRDIALMSLANNIDGLIISNSTIDRPSNLKSSLKNEIGGLSGKPLFIKINFNVKKNAFSYQCPNTLNRSWRNK